MFLPLLVISIAGCQPDPPIPGERENGILSIPIGFPAVEFPEDNKFTRARWELGKRLFFDPVLSRDSTVSCGSCHKPHLAFSDDVSFSPGVQNAPGVRNAPTLTNVAYLPYFTREGGVPTLEMQILVPLQEHNEFDFNIVDAGIRLSHIPEYVEMSELAYGREPDPFVITRSIANFERTLISGNSPFDRYFYQDNKDALNSLEIKGMNLFFSERTGCSDCHGGFNFTDNSFQNNGLYTIYNDLGRRRLTGNDNDLALFKVPTLRNTGLTAPYMHDGSFATLEAVIDHYNSGGEDHPHKSKLIRPLGLSNDEMGAIVAFLHALTDTQFVENKNFNN